MGSVVLTYQWKDAKLATITLIFKASTNWRALKSDAMQTPPAPAFGT